MFAAMDAATLPDLDQFDSNALKSLILALHACMSRPSDLLESTGNPFAA